MSDDWSWFWAGANGRDNLLREEVASLGVQLSSASATSSRLSSQLATLSGSIETRLNALSAAFDAYVELGDVREQLAAHPDTSSIRREVMSAVEALAAGRSVQPVDPRALGYWLPYAMNAVIAIAAGRPDAAAERTAHELSPDAETFIVASCGALGHGAAVADRVAPLLVSDGTLSPLQVAVWTAAYTGVFGPVLDQIEPGWRAGLNAAPNQTEWARWVADQAQSGASGALSWLRSQTVSASAPDEDHSPDPTAVTDARRGLQLVVTPLVMQGMGAEVALLDRARELRARIEDPASTPSRSSDRSGATADEATVDPSILAEVRRAFVSTAPGTAEHATLARWIVAGLTAATDGLRTQVSAPIDTSSQVSAGGRSVTVTAAGPDQAQLAVATENIQRANAIPPRSMYLGAAAGGMFLVIAVILVVGGNGVGGFLTLVLAGVAGAYAFSQYRARRAGQDYADSQIRELLADTDHHRVRAGEAEAQLRVVGQEAVAVADEVSRQLAALSDVRGSVRAQVVAGGGGV